MHKKAKAEATAYYACPSLSTIFHKSQCDAAEKVSTAAQVLVLVSIVD